MRIGIFGGSFNPPHLGHLHLAESVHAALALDEVRLVPSGISPHRSMEAYASAEDRLAMCRLAAEAYPWMCAEDYELSRQEKSYTYYTVRHFSQQYPKDTFFLLVGGDMLRSFQQWYRWQEILQCAELAGIAREPEEWEELAECVEKLRQYGKIHLVNVESYPLSSTKIRDMVQKNQDYSCYLPEKIVQYIRMKNLYRK